MRKLNYFPLLALTVISLLIDLYVFNGVKTLTQNIADNRVVVHVLYWSVSLSVLFLFIFMLSRVFQSRTFSLIFHISFNSFITLFVTKLVFAALLFFEDMYRVLGVLINTIGNSPIHTLNRSFTYSQIVFAISCIPFFSFLFGVTLGKYHYKVRRTTLFFDDLPEEFDDFTIAQISDIHAGSFDNPKAVQRGIDLINAQKPHLLCFTGDLVNNKASEIIPYIDIFKQIKAPHGKFSILGNHDYGDYTSWNSPEEKRLNLVKLKSYHADIGFRLLLDENHPVKMGGSQINIMGVENWGKGFGERGDLQKAMQGVNPSGFKILLSHDPSHWDAQVKKNPAKIHLTLSGHTHGMQFGFEIGKIKWSPAKYRYPNWAGLAGSGGRYLYVNRGFGFIGFAGRVGIWPEITIIHLKKR